MLLSQFYVLYAYCPKKQFRKYVNSSISWTIPLLSSPFFRKHEKAEFQFSFGALNLNEDQRSIILQAKRFPRQLQIPRYADLSQNFDWKMMVIISLKMRNPAFEIFIELGLLAVLKMTMQHLKR